VEKKHRNLARFIGIVICVVILEIFFWYPCPISLIFGICTGIAAILFSRAKMWNERFPKAKFFVIGVVFSLLWAIFYGFAEAYAFLNPESPLFLFHWFNSGIAMDYYAYWSLLIFSNGLILMFISRNLTFSCTATFFYLITEDASALTFLAIKFNEFPVFPSNNWFSAFPEIFPQWFISLGEAVPFWPYVPIIYVIIWIITIPVFSIQILLSFRFNKAVSETI